MRITGLTITDPRQKGVLVDPFIEIEVTEPVYEQDDPIFNGNKSLRYRVIPCGPFYAVEYRVDNGASLGPWKSYSTLSTNASLSELNKSELIKDQLIEVQVNTPEDVVDLAMPVQRVRRLMRKYNEADKWEIYVDEQAALFGDLRWRLELREPVCYGGATPAEANCSVTPSRIIVQKGTHLTLCSEHVRDHEARLAAVRTSRARRA